MASKSDNPNRSSKKHQLSIRAVYRDPVDIKKLSRALLELQLQKEKEKQAADQSDRAA